MPDLVSDRDPVGVVIATGDGQEDDLFELAEVCIAHMGIYYKIEEYRSSSV